MQQIMVDVALDRPRSDSLTPAEDKFRDQIEIEIQKIRDVGGILDFTSELPD